jgi:hypothetical protein
LAIYLVLVANRLQSIALYLSKVTFGVRAIEQQCAPIGPTVTDLNRTVSDIATMLPGIAERAERVAAP